MLLPPFACKIFNSVKHPFRSSISRSLRSPLDFSIVCQLLDKTIVQAVLVVSEGYPALTQASLNPSILSYCLILFEPFWYSWDLVSTSRTREIDAGKSTNCGGPNVSHCATLVRCLSCLAASMCISHDRTWAMHMSRRSVVLGCPSCAAERENRPKKTWPTWSTSRCSTSRFHMVVEPSALPSNRE